jgi:hypothetical protein
MSLCEALHGRQPWPELELPWEPMGSSLEKGERGGAARGRGMGREMAAGGGLGPWELLRSVLLCCSCVRKNWT